MTDTAGRGVRRVPVRDDLGVFEGYHSAQVEVAVRLNTNESPFPPPPAFVDALAAEVRDVDFHRYPDRRASKLRQALADLHGVEAANVVAANGSNEVLQALCLAYSGPGRSVLTFEPTYAMHATIARVTGARVVETDRDDDFELDVDAALAAIAASEPAITFLCSPNNPTGAALSRPLVEAVVDAAPGLVVVDEAYGQFSSWSAVDLVGDDRPLVVTRTYSKTWSLAALRLGYAIGPSWVVEDLDKVLLPYHLDALKQRAGSLALGFAADMERRVSLVVEERGRIGAALRDLAVDVWPSDANFVLFRPKERSGDDVWQGLVDRSVLVRNCSAWPRLRDCLRVTVGTPQENDAFLGALREVLA